jgi:hypothetical protein
VDGAVAEAYLHQETLQPALGAIEVNTNIPDGTVFHSEEPDQ